MTSDLLAPQQQRSRDTLARLLSSTIAMLEKHGLGGATIPRIASAASVAPASVYRRFRDRDALYRAAFLSALAKSAEADRLLNLEAFKKHTLEGVVRELVGAIIQQYRSHRRLLTALTRFLEDDDDQRFRKRVLAIVAGNFRTLIELVLGFRAQIAHPDPERAVAFGLLSAASSIELRALDQLSVWREVLPISDQELQAELTRSFLAYLYSKAPVHPGGK